MKIRKRGKRKKDNLVIFNLEEGEGTDEIADCRHDIDKVKSVIKVIDPTTEFDDFQVRNVCRMGKRKTGPDAKPRPVKITVK